MDNRISDEQWLAIMRNDKAKEILARTGMPEKNRSCARELPAAGWHDENGGKHAMIRSGTRPIYWGRLDAGEWNVRMAASGSGLLYVCGSDEPFDRMQGWLARIFPDCKAVRDDEAMKLYATEMDEYFRGVRTTFSMPIDLLGTPFQRTVWKALEDIPYGETRTYSDIAASIGRPDSTRAVGAAIGANPVMIAVPCHRVIGKDGSLTGFRGGLPFKLLLLRLERETVSLRRPY